MQYRAAVKRQHWLLSKTGQSPKPFCISLRKVGRTVITRWKDTVMSITPNPPRKSLWCEKRRKLKCQFVSVRGKTELLSCLRAWSDLQLVAHIKLWQWQIKVRKELQAPTSLFLLILCSNLLLVKINNSPQKNKKKLLECQLMKSSQAHKISTGNRKINPFGKHCYVVVKMYFIVWTFRHCTKQILGQLVEHRCTVSLCKCSWLGGSSISARAAQQMYWIP